MRHPIRVAVAVATTAALAGCSGAQLEQSRGMTTQGSAFNAALYDGYMMHSEHEYGYGDYASSDVYANRAAQAADGDRVQPFSLEGEPISSTDGAGMVESKSPQIVEARRALMDVMNNGGRTDAPQATAEAQVAFDCWLEETQPAHMQECRERFDKALKTAQAAVEPEAKPTAAAEPMEPERATVYFGFDDADVQSGETGKIADAVKAYNDMPEGAELSVTGHADRAGADDYNRTLSIERARNVKAALVARGVPASAISVAARGEGQTAVSTPDGAREAANRRVEIVVG